MKQTWQQGDVIGRRLRKMPAGEKKPVASGRILLAHGESGHSHVVDDEEAQLIQIGHRMLLRLGRSAVLVHQEHKPIALEPGIWEICRVREFDYFKQMVRQVKD